MKCGPGAVAHIKFLLRTAVYVACCRDVTQPTDKQTLCTGKAKIRSVECGQCTVGAAG